MSDCPTPHPDECENCPQFVTPWKCNPPMNDDLSDDDTRVRVAIVCDTTSDQSVAACAAFARILAQKALAEAACEAAEVLVDPHRPREPYWQADFLAMEAALDRWQADKEARHG